MNKRFALTGLLMVAPLLMANSPAPFATTDSYEEVSISNVSQTGNIIYFDLTNNGDKYICEGDSMTPIYGSLLQGNASHPCNCMPVDLLFENQGLAPGATARYYTELSYNINADSLTGFKTYALTTRDENVTHNNPTFTKTGDKVYTFNAEITGKGDYYYTTIIDVTYNEKDYCFGYSDWKDKSNEIETAEELDLSKFEIKDVKFFRSMYNTYKGGYDVGPSTNSTQPNTSPIGSTNRNTPSNGGAYGKVAIDPTVPLLVTLIVVGGIAVVVAPVVIAIVVNKKKKK